MRKRLWSPDEDDDALCCSVERLGCGNWTHVARLTGLEHHSPKSCRLCWVNYLRPGLKHGPFSSQELRLLVCLQAHFGNRWSQIAAYIPGRSDNDVKNAWHLCNRRRQRHPSKDTDSNISSSLSFMQCKDQSDPMPKLLITSSTSSKSTQSLAQNKPLIDVPPNNDQPP
ncbi:hypothetical protein GOP47_0002084 [Adiantum capillus-veneris]|nr:hypothetical protein GOP47_0002084 [Adiantum capillus-veneris]